MAGYPYVSQVQDPAAAKALKGAFDKLADLERRIRAIESTALLNTGLINANSQRIGNLATPQAGTDAVNLTYLQTYLQAQLEAFK